MAEIALSFIGTLTNGSLQDAFPNASLAVTQSVAKVDGPTVSVTTSEADVSFPSISTNGYLWMRNIDDTNFVKYGPKSGGSMIEFGRLYPGEIAVYRLATGVTLRMIADTATCKVQFKHWNN